MNENMQDGLSSTDEELEELLYSQKKSIKVIGSGGGGNNTINRIQEVGIKGAETIAVNTDAQDLLYTEADKKILIGRDITEGTGAGADPSVGREAAKENSSEIKRAVKDADMVFITCGLGGGTGTGSVPEIAKMAKKTGALTVAIVTVPFDVEGEKRKQNAQEGLERLSQVVDTLIVIPNDKLLEIAPNLPLNTAFKFADEILTNAVKGISELVTKQGLVNLDFADIRTVMSDGGVSMIGLGESSSENRAEEAIERAVNNPLIDVDIKNATGALVNIVGGENLSLNESKEVIEVIDSLLSEDSKLIWGAQISKDMGSLLRVMIIVTGVQSSQIMGKSHSLADVEKSEVENELGIQFVD